MALLRFAFLCIHLLAWPAIALGYPLFASIKAIESDSKHHMKKMVIYWTLFSLFSLFEYAFVKIIEWIPFWSTVRLMVVYWLVVPQFDGANHAYQGLLRSVLFMKLQAVINRFHELREVRIHKRGTILDTVEKYIKENGPEAVEKLIAMEHDNNKWTKSRRETKVGDSEGRNDALASKQLIEPQAALRDGEAVQATEKTKETQSHQIPYAKSTSSLNQEDAVVKVKEKIATPEASADNMTPPLMKTQQEWTCDICNVTKMNEITLDAHLKGSKHKSKIDSLKGSMLGVRDARPPSPLGSKHKSNLETLMKASNPCANITVPSHSETSQINQANVCAKFIEETVSELEKIITDKVQIEANETAPPEGSAKNQHAKTHPINEEWRCHLCEVKVTSLKTLNYHFGGSKHKAKLMSLKDGSGILRKGKMSERWCLICNLKLLSDANVASHLKGKKHASNIEALNSLDREG